MGVDDRRESEAELRLLLDCVVLNKPLLLASGFVVLDARRRKRRITSLADLAVGQVYSTEKGTSLFRRSDNELLLGGEFEIETIFFFFFLKRLAHRPRRDSGCAAVARAHGARPNVPSDARSLATTNAFACTRKLYSQEAER